MLRHVLALGAMLLAGAVTAEPVSSEVRWTHDGERYAGHVVHDPAHGASQPGLLMVPNWMGVNERALALAGRIAAEGYVVLLVDMYGESIRPDSPAAAREASQAVREAPGALHRRARAALQAMQALPAEVPLDRRRIGAIGFCFGGTVVLELARGGADLDGVVSFHGGLEAGGPIADGGLRTPVLVLNGADDPLVGPDEIDAFQTEMREAGADWQFVNFSGAVHCFAEPGADSGPACQYHERSAERAYRMMNGFFAEAFEAR